MTRGADEEVELRLVRRQASRPVGRLAAAASGGRARRSRRGRRRRAGSCTGPARQAAPSKISDIGSNFDYTFRAGLFAPGLDAPRQALAHVLARTRKGRLQAALRFRLPSAKSKAAEMGRAGMEPALSPRLRLRSCYRARG